MENPQMTTMDYYNKNVESNGTYVPVERYTDEYCKALTENYKQETMRSYERWIMSGSCLSCTHTQEESAEYYGEKLLEILRGEANLDRFRYIVGKKYFKVVRESFDEFQGRNKWRDTTVHAFVDRVTGEVYKPAGWKAPAKHVRFNLSDDLDRAKLHDPNFVGWAGGYLYLR